MATYVQVNVPVEVPVYVTDSQSRQAGAEAAYDRVLALLDALPAESFDAATVLHIRQAVASWGMGQAR